MAEEKKSPEHPQEDPAVAPGLESFLASFSTLVERVEEEEEEGEEGDDQRDEDYQPEEGEEEESTDSSAELRLAVPSTSAGADAAEAAAAAALQADRRRKKPARCTLYRRRYREEKDGRVLEELAQSGAPLPPPGQPCGICGQVRRLDTGHGYYWGQFFCQADCGQTLGQWLLEAQGDAAGHIPRTTAWRMNKGLPKKHKPHKPMTCQKCGHVAQKAFGHSNLGTSHFCALYHGIPVNLWLAIQRSKIREEARMVEEEEEEEDEDEAEERVQEKKRRQAERRKKTRLRQ